MQTQWNRPSLVMITVVAAASVARADPAPSAPAPAAVDETQRTEAALRAIDKHWGDAETEGDVAYIEQLLAPEYRSIDAKGTTHARAAILDHTKRNRGHAAEGRKAVEAYMQAHPTEMAVALHGTIGIVSFYNPQRGVDHSIRGADVFVYEGDRWHAVYSLHNSAE